MLKPSAAPGWDPAEFDAACPVWNVVMRALKIAGAAVAAVIVVAALLLIIGMPSGFMTSAIQARVERDTGYRLSIAGTTKIGMWPSLNVTMNDVTLQDPKDRDGSNRLTAGSIQADITLASVWSGRPQITELVIVRPVLYVPLLRERSGPANPSSRPATSSGATENNTPTIERITVTDGAVAFSNLRDRVDSRIDGINANAEIGSDRNVKVTGSARGGDRPGAADRAAEHSGRAHARCRGHFAGAAVGQGRSPAQRLGGHDQRAYGSAGRQRLQRLGVGRSFEQAAGQTRPRLP